MKYKYVAPEKVQFENLLQEFTGDYGSLSQEEVERVLNVNVWAYGICSSNPQNPFSPGAPYNQPGCLPS